MEWIYGKQEDHRWVLVLRMTKAESSWALVAGKNTPLALSHLVLLQAAQQRSFPCCPGFGNKVWLQKKVGGKGLRSCKKTFGSCGVDLARQHRDGVQSKVCFALQSFIGSCRLYLMGNTTWCWEWMSCWPRSWWNICMSHFWASSCLTVQEVQEEEMTPPTPPQPTSLRALRCNSLVLVLHPECNDSVPLLYPRQPLGTTEFREIATEDRLLQ